MKTGTILNIQRFCTDDGPGIREEEVQVIFDRFHKGVNGNHGLGLAIAKRSLDTTLSTQNISESENSRKFP